jgi:putative transposase
MKKRNSYHTAVKLIFALGLEHELLPKEFVSSISRSTYNQWRHQDESKFVGAEFANMINDNVDDIKLFIDKRMKREKSFFTAVAKIKITLFNILGKKEIKAAFKHHSHDLLRVIESTKNSFSGGFKSICSLLDIKTKTYNYWKSIANFNCTLSPFGICLNLSPSQATPKEIGIIKRLLTCKEFAHWPICSVWGHAVREHLVSLSLPTWYRYNSKLLFRIKEKKGKYRGNYVPLEAPHANHTWHADITIFKTLDGVKHYIYLIVDNYSKFILNWKIASSANGLVRTQTIRETIHEQFGENLASAPSVDLIVDGGTENNNVTVHDFIKDCEVDINKKIALKDIVQSNSMVEAANKTLKYRYLFLKDIYNLDDLLEHLPKAIYDYCYLRPHYKLGIRTPHEAHYNIFPEINPDFKKNAIKERINSNKNNSCSIICS